MPAAKRNMARRLIKKPVGEILLDRGLITPQDLDRALAYQQVHGGFLGQIFVKLGLVSEEDVALALTAQYGFPFLPLDSYEIEEGIAKLVPEHVARQYFLIPIDRVGHALTVAMADPSNEQAIEDIELLTQCAVQTFISTPSEIQKAIERSYGRGANTPPSSPSANSS